MNNNNRSRNWTTNLASFGIYLDNVKSNIVRNRRDINTLHQRNQNLDGLVAAFRIEVREMAQEIGSLGELFYRIFRAREHQADAFDRRQGARARAAAEAVGVYRRQL
jgi:hypothetical protein